MSSSSDQTGSESTGQGRLSTQSGNAELCKGSEKVRQEMLTLSQQRHTLEGVVSHWKKSAKEWNDSLLTPEQIRGLRFRLLPSGAAMRDIQRQISPQCFAELLTTLDYRAVSKDIY